MIIMQLDFKSFFIKLQLPFQEILALFDLCCVFCMLKSTGVSFGTLSEWDQTLLFERSLFSLMASASRLHWHFPCFAISELFIATCILMTASGCFPLLSLELFWIPS